MSKVNRLNSYWHKTPAVLLLAIVSSGCVTIKTGAHYDESVSFDNYRSFAWIAENPHVVGEGEPRSVSPLAEKKIVQSIEDELIKRGFTYVDNADEADFVVAYTVGTREKIVVESYPTAYQGRWGWHLYGRYYYQTEVVHRTYSEGTLGIDIFDGKTGEPVWHGWASRQLSRVDNVDPSPAIRKAVAAIINRFPAVK